VWVFKRRTWGFVRDSGLRDEKIVVRLTHDSKRPVTAVGERRQTGRYPFGEEAESKTEQTLRFAYLGIARFLDKKDERGTLEGRSF
jgi:hypothetical protein